MASESEARGLLVEDTSDIVEEFVHSARDLLGTARSQLREGDTQALQTGLKAILRSAEFLMLGQIEQVATSVLTRLDKQPKGDMAAVSSALEVLGELLNRLDRTGSDRGIDDEVAQVKSLLERENREEPDDDDFDDEELFSAAMSEMFKDEALAQLDAVEAALLQVEEGSEDPELLHGAFRAMHSLKGNCGCIGMFELEETAHKVEDLLDEIRRDERELTGGLNSVILEIIDAFRKTVTDLTTTQGAIDGRERLLARLAEAAAAGATEAPPALEIAPEVPPPGDNPDAARASEPSTTEAPPQASATPAPASQTEPTPEPTPGSPQGKSAAPAPTPAESKPAPKVTAPRFIRVDVSKLDAMLNQVGELISAAASVVQSPDLDGLELDQFQAAAGQLNRVTASLHDTAMSMRMVPLDGLFSKMVRIVRDLRQRLGKRVELEIAGEQTEVDKSVMESIADPLVHIIRNAVDHGIEGEDERIAAGKDAIGHVRLEARHQGSEVWIIVQDDGKGIDPKKLVDSAIRKGVIEPDEAPTSPQEAYQLMFLPGFSTAAAVTNVSGRGVGMDVVRREIESVRGRVEVRSQIGAGTTFTIRLPLTLAIIDAMIVRVESSLYALPLLSVRESLCTTAEQVTTLPDRTAMVRIRDRMVPIVGLDQVYASHRPPKGVCDGILILVEDGDDAFCLRVDEMLGQRQTVIKPLEGFLGSIQGISGCSIMGSGDICLIIDVAAIAARRHGAERRVA